MRSYKICKCEKREKRKYVVFISKALKKYIQFDLKRIYIIICFVYCFSFMQMYICYVCYKCLILFYKNCTSLKRCTIFRVSEASREFNVWYFSIMVFMILCSINSASRILPKKKKSTTCRYLIQKFSSKHFLIRFWGS